MKLPTLLQITYLVNGRAKFELWIYSLNLNLISICIFISSPLRASFSLQIWLKKEAVDEEGF